MFIWQLFELKWSLKKKSILLSIAELHFSLTTTHLTVGLVRRRLFMMSLVHQVLMIGESILVVDSLNWKSGRSRYHSCADTIQPYRQQLLESETSFCDICHKNCTSPADFVLHQERVHLCLPLFIFPYLSLHLYYPFLLTYAYYWISWWSSNSNLFILVFWNCRLLLSHSFMMWFFITYMFVYIYIVIDLCLLERIFKYMFSRHERMNGKIKT